MRRFGADKPELMSFKLFDSEEVYTMPLAASMPATKILEMQEAYKAGDAEALEFQIETLRIYIGDIVDKLSAGDIREIYIEWGIQSSDQGATPGESEASSGSSTNTDEH